MITEIKISISQCFIEKDKPEYRETISNEDEEQQNCLQHTCLSLKEIANSGFIVFCLKADIELPKIDMVKLEELMEKRGIEFHSPSIIYIRSVFIETSSNTIYLTCEAR